MVVVVVDIFVYDTCRCTSHPLLILCAYSSTTITVGASMTVRNCMIPTCKMSNLKFFFIVFVVIDAIVAVLLVLILMWLGKTADFYLVP